MKAYYWEYVNKKDTDGYDIPRRARQMIELWPPACLDSKASFGDSLGRFTPRFRTGDGMEGHRAGRSFLPRKQLIVIEKRRPLASVQGN